MLLLACAGFVGCEFSNDVLFGSGQPPGDGGWSEDPEAGSNDPPADDSGLPPVPRTCTDGLKNGDEPDVDCGAVCRKPCNVGASCFAGDDCIEGVCTSNLCQPATGFDNVQNGDESDVDCGGRTTGAPRCDIGKSCVVRDDCVSNGCKDSICIEAPSCAVHFGGDTCGTGEIEPANGDPIEHESCCRSLPVANFTDANHPGKTVHLDKYEITAGRMREFLTAMAQGNNGEPNVLGFVQAERQRAPALWQWWLPAWDEMMPVARLWGAVQVGGQTYSTGTFHALSVENYFRGQSLSHGLSAYHNFNCINSDGGYGFATYHIPNGTVDGSRKHYSQEVLDQKSLNCTPSALFAAFCAWDGGQLATAAVYDAVMPSVPGNVTCANGFNVSIDGSQTCGPLLYPEVGGQTYDGSSRIRAPGRIAVDRHEYSGQTWADLYGNLVETALAQDGSFVLRGDGIGARSTELHASDEFRSHRGKGSSVGARCMRFR